MGASSEADEPSPGRRGSLLGEDVREAVRSALDKLGSSGDQGVRAVADKARGYLAGKTESPAPAPLTKRRREGGEVRVKREEDAEYDDEDDRRCVIS